MCPALDLKIYKLCACASLATAIFQFCQESPRCPAKRVRVEGVLAVTVPKVAMTDARGVLKQSKGWVGVQGLGFLAFHPV